MKFKFEKLIVWQKAMDLAEKVHLLRKSFSEDEKFNLSSQILRAADSIALHISEGSIGRTNLDFTRYLGYSVGSLSEVVSCLHEKVVDTGEHLDAGMVYGTGFAPFRGGPLRYIETQGADTLLQRLQDLEKRLGSRFTPAPGWETVAGFTDQESING